MKIRLSRITEDGFLTAGKAVARFARELRSWKNCSSVLLFLSMKDEINTLPLLENALEDGKAVFAPRIENDCLKFYRVFSRHQIIEKGKFGIGEPPPDNPLKNTGFPLLVFAPGLAFDKYGNRLGRGKGYYDRFFNEIDEVKLPYTAAGLCMEFQIIDSVPVSKSDKKMHFLLNEKGTITAEEHQS